MVFGTRFHNHFASILARRQLTGKALNCAHCQSPDIASFRWLLKSTLWRNILACGSLSQNIAHANILSKTHTANFYLAICGQKNVLRLEVAVNIVLFMHVREPLQYLTHYCGNSFFR